MTVETKLYDLPKLSESAAKIFDPVIILNLDALRIANSARIDSFTKLECGEGLFICEYVHIASFVHVLGGGTCIMEEGSSFGSGVKIITGSNVPGPNRGCSAIAPNSVVKRSCVHIKRNAVMFCNSVVLPGITIGEGAVIAAGAVVTKNVPDGETWGGIPAKKINRLPIETFSLGPIEIGESGQLSRRSASDLSQDMFVEGMAELYGWGT